MFGSREECFFHNFCPQREDLQKVSDFLENVSEVSSKLSNLESPVSLEVYWNIIEIHGHNSRGKQCRTNTNFVSLM